MPPIHPLLVIRLRPLSRFPTRSSSSVRPLSHRFHLHSPLPPSALRRCTYSTDSDPESSPRPYTFAEIQSLSSTSAAKSSSSSPNPKRILIDVREPSELAATGRIPGAFNMPLTTNPDAFHLSAEDFFDRFGFEKPRSREDPVGGAGGKGERAVDEVIFYCKAGVRSRAAARLAREWEGVHVGDFRGGWLDWEGNGGEKETN